MTSQTKNKLISEWEQLLEKAGELLGDLEENLLVDHPETTLADALLPISDEWLFETEYSGWYTRAHLLVAQVIPHRLMEFERLYYAPNSRLVLDGQTATIQDWLMRNKPAEFSWEVFSMHTLHLFEYQHQIFKSVGTVLDSVLANIRGMLRADLFSDELAQARELLATGFVRAAGVVAGVVLEHKLQAACTDNQVKFDRPGKPAMGDLVEGLRRCAAIGEDEAMLLKRLTTLRNNFIHPRPKEPDAGDAEELIRGVERFFESTLVAPPPSP